MKLSNFTSLEIGKLYKITDGFDSDKIYIILILGGPRSIETDQNKDVRLYKALISYSKKNKKLTFGYEKFFEIFENDTIEELT